MWLCSVELLAVAEFNKVIEDASPLGKDYGERHEGLEERARALRGTARAPSLLARASRALWLPAFLRARAARKRGRALEEKAAGD
jgi:membrane protein